MAAIMTDVRAELLKAEQELDRLRGEMDAEADANGGHIEHDLAVKFAARLEDVNGRIWDLRGRLPTPPTAAG